MDPEFARLYGFIDVDRNKVMTGQVIFRKTKQAVAPNDDTDRELAIIVGVVAIPKDAKIGQHHQYPIMGEFDDTPFNSLQIQVDLEDGEDRDEQLTGDSLTGIVRLPIWRT